MALPQDWPRLGRHVREARRDLGMSQDDLARESGLSRGTVQAIERAVRTSYAPATRTGTERALRWRPGSWDDVLAGGYEEPADPGSGGGDGYLDAWLAYVKALPPAQALAEVGKAWAEIGRVLSGDREAQPGENGPETGERGRPAPLRFQSAL